MTQEEKQLLLKDLCARLPYGVKIMFSHNGFRWDWEQTLDEIKPCDDDEYSINGWGIHGIKPYLRPMSSLIEKELDECRATCKYRQVGQSVLDCATPETIDYLIAHHFDYRGLIEMGLALEAPEGMYKTE